EMDSLFSYAISADGRWFAGAEENVLKIWKVASNGDVSSPLTLAKGSFLPIAFSPKSTWLAASTLDGTELIWRLDDFESSPHSLTNNPGTSILSIAFSPAEDVVATGAFGAVRLRALGKHGPQLADSIYHPRSSLDSPYAYALAFSNDGIWLAIAGNGDRV